MNKNYSLITFLCLAFVTFFISQQLNGQSAVNSDTIKIAAHEIMNETHYCGLVTIDSEGQPQMRTMNPFPANDELITWFATSRTSRKVAEIKNNPKVCVYYADHVNAKGYVSIAGTAQVIDDKDLLVKMKRDYWNGIPDWQNKFVLIKIIPKKMEVINYKHGLNNDPNTLKAPSITFQN
jgi:general stress protein 26